MTAHVSVEGLRVAYEGHTVIDGLTGEFPRGRISVVLGGSGVGKSTLLNVIAGLIRPSAGTIRIDGREMTRTPERVWDEARQKIGMLFQGGALLDSLTVFENLALPLRERTRLDRREIADTVHKYLTAVGLTDVDHKLPGELSGGMRKRVALARALMKEPQILLADEPFAGLDPISTKRIEDLLLQCQRERSMTLIAVSHEPAFAMTHAEHALVLTPRGAVAGAPADLREAADARVRSFLGAPVDPALLEEES